MWNPFTSGTTQDFISVELDDSTGAVVFATPDFDQTNALNGTATSVDIPGATLLSGVTYSGRLLFSRRTAINTNSIPGALGIAAYFKSTEFSLTTLGTGGCTYVLNPTNKTFTATGGTGTITVTAPNGCDWTATNNDSFITLTSTNAGSGTSVVGYSVATNGAVELSFGHDDHRRPDLHG